MFLLPIDNGMNGADENLDDKNFEPIVKKTKQKRKKRIKGIPGIKEEKGTPSYLKVRNLILFLKKFLIFPIFLHCSMVIFILT